MRRLAIAVAIFALTSCSLFGGRLGAVRPLPQAQAGKIVARAVIGAVGDVLMHGAVEECAIAHASSPNGGNAGYNWLYSEVARELRQSDLMFANLETPIAPSANTLSKSFIFNAPVESALALKYAGVDVVSVANNHAFDQGRSGFLETLASLDSIDLPHIGAGIAPKAAGPRFFDVKGIRIAMLGWAHLFNQPGNDCAEGSACMQIALLEAEQAEAAVRAAASQADAVIASIHWGEEYAVKPREEDIALARRLAEAGATIVLGHHPHVLQPLEVHRRADGTQAVIAYSLGNFISNQSRLFPYGDLPEQEGATRDGALVRIELAKIEQNGVTRTAPIGLDYVPLWTENDTWQVEAQKDPSLKPSIRVVALDRVRRDARAKIAALSADHSADAARQRGELAARETLYVRRMELISEALGPSFRAR